MGRNHDVIKSISKYFILRRSRVANFADIIKIIKTAINNSKKGKKNSELKRNLYFLIQQKLLISSERKWVSQQNSKGVSRDLYIFGSSFSKV